MKRIILYILFSIMFLYLGITKQSDIVYIDLLNMQFDIIGSALRFLSLENAFFNVISMLLYIIIGSTPILLFMYLRVKRGASNKDYLLFPLSFLLFYGLYYAVNQHLLINHFPEEILSGMSLEDYEIFTSIYLSGINAIFYALLAIYLILIFLNESNLKIKQTLLFIIDIIVVFILAILFISVVPSIVDAIKSAATSYDNTMILITIIKNIISYGLMSIIIYYTLITTKSFDIEDKKLYHNVNKLFSYTFSYIIVTLGFVIFENSIIFLLRNQTDNSTFVIEIPLLTLVLSGIVLLISKYIKDSNLIKEDNELII